MTDHIPADKLRELVEKADEGRYSAGSFLRRVKELLPEPARPTLADMTPEEREKCHLMQCDVRESDEFFGGRGVVISLNNHDLIVIDKDGTYWGKGHPLENFTPRPDLPRMVWPDSDVSKSAPEIDTSTPHADPIDMSPKPGEAWLVKWGDKEVVAYKADDTSCPWCIHDPNEEGNYTWPDVDEVAPISRLVPETPRKLLVTREDYKNASIGTVAKGQRDSDLPAQKLWASHWQDTAGGERTDIAMASTPREVIWEPED